MGKQLLYFFVGTALTLLLQWAAGLLGPAGFLLGILSPLPAVYVHMRCGVWAGGGVVGVCAALLAAAGDPGGGIGYLLQFGLASFFLPLLLRREWPWDQAAAATVGVVIAFSLPVLAGYSLAGDVSVTDLVGRYIQGEVDRAMTLYQQAELQPEQLEELRVFGERMAGFFRQAWPGLAVVVTAVVVLVMVLFLASISGGSMVPGLPFHLWKAPEALVWFLIAAGVGLVFSGGLLRTAALNLLVVVLPVYFLQGLAIVSFYFRKKGFPPFLRALGYMMVAVLNPLPLIVTGIGVFDLWADFRRPRNKKT